jgi:hypothetical protein
MDLKPVGGTVVEPETVYLWESENKCTVEITPLDGDYFLVRAVKSYNILKQSEEGKENWDRNLSSLNEHLENHFSNFQLSVNYSNTVDLQALELSDDAEDVVKELSHKREELNRVEQKVEDLESSLENSFDELAQDLNRQVNNLRRREESLASDVARLESKTGELLDKFSEWKSNGVLLSFVFSFSTDPQIVRFDELEQIVELHVDDVFDMHRRRVKQTLQGENYQLLVEELEFPRAFLRFQRSGLLSPSSLDGLQDEFPVVADSLEELRGVMVEQFEGYALQDLEVDSKVFERSKVTPARSVQSLLKDLDREKLSVDPDAPNDGPIVGTLPGTDRAVGFDPAERLIHAYIAGETGSGKSYLKRVLLENCCSLGYDVLTISPSDREEIGLSLPNPDNDDSSTGLAATHYWPGSDYFNDLPEDNSDLFTGLNAVTLHGLNGRKKQEIIEDIFSSIGSLKELDNPLFVFLEEAHEFSSGTVASTIQDVVREKRKFGVHVVLVSQDPKDFQREYKRIRQNTSTVFLRLEEGEEYARQVGITSPETVSGLDRGEALFNGLDMPETLVDVRKSLTLPVSPSQDEIKELDNCRRGQVPRLDTSGDSAGSVQDSELSGDKSELLDFIQRYIRENDEAPSVSKMYREGPFSQDKTERLVEKLVEQGVLTSEWVEQYGQEYKVYRPT